jgi:hypothetical protein
MKAVDSKHKQNDVQHITDSRIKSNAVNGLDILRAIASDLDTGGTPRVCSGGVVLPDPDRWGIVEMGSFGKGDRNGFKGAASRSGRSAAGTGTGTAGQGSTGSARTSGTAASQLGKPRLIDAVVGQLEGAKRHYPALAWRFAPTCIWSHVWVRPIPTLWESVLFITWHSTLRACTAFTWAWWHHGIPVGPRHTNWGADVGGSVCAYDKGDNIPDDDFTLHLDLGSLWALRHTHLAIFGRWPGHQALHSSYERIAENGLEEFCGGCTSGRTYGDCCRARDLAMTPAERWRDFRKYFDSNSRRIPAPVIEFRREIWC